MTTTLDEPLVIDMPDAPDALPPAAVPAPDVPARRDPKWAKPALAALLVGTAALYLWNLGASGWGNSFYSAAVQAGTKSWKAFFFGSSDASNFITVDKPPASLWIMELSARIFGLSSWSVLVPQALEGVAAVGILHAAVKRWFGAGAGLAAGAILALTPAAALMFRFNNPDALLVLLMTAAGYTVMRALEDGRTRWLVAAGGLIGFGFLTKMMQAFVVVPPFALAYLVAGPPALGKRIRQLLAAGASLAVSSLWWVVAVMAIPAASRPYIGGSQNNSLWNLIFGYNGFGRLTGDETGSVGGGGGNSGRWGATGLLRMFNGEFGGQASWLIPAALILMAGALAIGWRAKRTDRTRAALIIWGGWLLVTTVVFSLGEGIIHPYYAVALGPGIGATAAIGGAALWARRHTFAARAVLAGALATTSYWAHQLLDRTPSYVPWLRTAVVGAGMALAFLILAWGHLHAKLAAGLAVAGITVALSGPAAYSLTTANTTHSGALPSAGPAGQGNAFGPGGGRGPGGGAFPGGARQAPPSFAGAFPGGNPMGGAGRTGGAGGVGGLLNSSTSNSAMTAALQADASKYTWAAATVGSNSAAGYQLASGEPVMAIGGFNGSDPTPTLAAFQALVSAGKIHYFIPGGGMVGGPGGGNANGTSTSSQITAWVEANFTSTTIGGTTVYVLG